VSHPEEISLKHLQRITDDTGLIQHCIHSVPRREEGYCSDDNARALVFVAREYKRTGRDKLIDLANIYLSFLQHAQDERGHFRNFLSYDRKWSDTCASDDCQGRCLWAMAETVNSGFDEGMRRLARELFERGMSQLDIIRSLRGVAISLMGLEVMYRITKNREYLEKAVRGADFLMKSLESSKLEDWVWFEPVMTYANARIPHGLFCAYRLTGNRRYLEAAEETFRFLTEKTTSDGIFVPIGNDGWYERDGKKALYDQQPLEACTMVEAAACAYKITGRKEYLETAKRAFGWFLGRNTKGVVLCDESRGSCYDALTPSGANLNEGAESTLSYLLSLQTILLYNIDRNRKVKETLQARA